jgi:predicted glycogen debranching enzyme
MAANTTGAALRAPVAWSELNSRYDALLASNPSSGHPDDRWIMLARCRMWLVYQDYSQQLNLDCLQRFNIGADGTGFWRFLVPCGQGQRVAITVSISLSPAGNRTEINLTRHRARKKPENLPDDQPVQIIVRPDIENRNFHGTTKAYTGPETTFGAAVSPLPDGFEFNPDGRHCLHMQISSGEYITETEWLYMVHRKAEAERGLDPDSDLFSPGYFKTTLDGGTGAAIAAATGSTGTDPPIEQLKAEPAGASDQAAALEGEPLKTLAAALDTYVVKRGKLHSVIAGFPWFLDWGRDALIFSRGLIAGGRLEVARSVLMQFGQFEENGTLPNMIAGNQAANRDTSDAPLWFFTTCNDLLQAEGSQRFLKKVAGNRTVGEILKSIASAIVRGTPNGVRMDPESALVYSPGHFTWMDTDHPAGTPRQGYPIEIQALWVAALDLLTRIDAERPAQDWAGLKARARQSLIGYFWLEADGYFSDCLHAAGQIPASAATPDDALRPNQLLAITLGAVSDKDMARAVLAACEELLVPGAIRSLADRPVRHRLEIFHNEKLLNDPEHPYQGTYSGDEDTRRKPAYHNGTAWTWQFPLYCEAWSWAYGPEGGQTALAWLTSSIRLMDEGCVGHIPEIVDGSVPHRQRGCDAQAWGVSEWVRVWTKITSGSRFPVQPENS